MCGRYALALTMWQIRQQLIHNNMPLDADEPAEEEHEHEPRQSYNVAPGYNEVVYRAYHPFADAGHQEDGEAVHDEQPDEGIDATADDGETGENGAEEGDVSGAKKSPKKSPKKKISKRAERPVDTSKVNYKLQSMKWGLIPFWTKRNPDYGSLMRTINCRDDSLIEDKGMWTSMKKKKRCIVVAQGFYEWLKLDGGKKKVPHFIKRKDGNLMCMAGLWDRCTYEDSTDPVYSFSIITTANNKAMDFLHDRMPVILENGSEDMKAWLDPSTTTWSKDLQSLLKPYPGELEIYPVPHEVGKVGNNSPNFILPIDSKENKNNIKNFFANAADAKDKKGSKDAKKFNDEEPAKKEKKEEDEEVDVIEDLRDNEEGGAKRKAGMKREHSEQNLDESLKRMKKEEENQEKASPPPVKKYDLRQTMIKAPTKSPTKKSVERNNAAKDTPKITQFFGAKAA